MKKVNDFFNSIKEDPQNKSIAFFGFYLVFFIFVFLFTTYGNIHFKNTEYEYGDIANDFKALLEKNYLYDYKVVLDNELFDYYGKRYDDVESFKYNNLDYYHNVSYYVKKDNWEEVENPYRFYEFLDYSNYSNIITNSYYVDNKELDNGDKEFNFKLLTNNLNKILYDKDTDFEEIPDDMSIITDDKGIIKNINMSLNSFCKLNNMCKESLKIELSFDMVNEIKEIDNPLQ